jgi:hypothetical protein
MSDTYWATSLIVQANKLSAQAHRLRAIAREKRRRARNLAKDGLIPQCDLDALLCEGLAPDVHPVASGADIEFFE